MIGSVTKYIYFSIHLSLSLFTRRDMYAPRRSVTKLPKLREPFQDALLGCHRHREFTSPLCRNYLETLHQIIAKLRDGNRKGMRSASSQAHDLHAPILLFGRCLEPLTCLGWTPRMDYFSRGSRPINQALTTKAANPVATCSQRERRT